MTTVGISFSAEAKILMSVGHPDRLWGPPNGWALEIKLTTGLHLVLRELYLLSSVRSCYLVKHRDIYTTTKNVKFLNLKVKPV
jgi:hypothetical protein